MNPLPISAIVRAYNAEKFLAPALASIREQSRQPQEILVIDDGSTDSTSRIAAGWGVHRVWQPRSGPAAALNLGIRQSTGDFIAFLDADDLWTPWKLETQWSGLEQSGAGVALGRARYLLPCQGEGSDLSYQPTGEAFLTLLTGAALFSRTVFEQVGLFDESLECSEDMDWFLRAAEAEASIIVGEEVALLYRRHENSLTAGRSAIDLQCLQVLKRSLDRRRKPDGTAKPLRSFIG